MRSARRPVPCKPLLPTGAMSAIFEKHANRLDEFVNRLQAQPDQVGAVFALGDAICGLDVFDNPATFAALLPKLVRSYGIDALERPDDGGAEPGVDSVRDFPEPACRRKTRRTTRHGSGLRRANRGPGRHRRSSGGRVEPDSPGRFRRTAYFSNRLQHPGQIRKPTPATARALPPALTRPTTGDRA